MGYRLRLGKVSKADHEKYKSYTREQFNSEFGEDEFMYRPPFHKQLFELGKYIDFSKDLIDFYDVQEDNDSEFKIMSKDQLREVIKKYHEWTSEYMNKLYECACAINDLEYKLDPSINPKEEIMSFFHGMKQEWEREKYSLAPYYLDEPDEKRDGRVIGSWKIQYSVLNLVYIYQTLDWENDLLIYSGW